MKKAIIIGASSGIGRELAKVLAEDYDVIGLTARRIDLLEALCAELGTKAYTAEMDVSNTQDAILKLNALIAQMDGVDLAVICAGTGHTNPELIWELEKKTNDVNVQGFACMADTFINHFIKQGSGHLVGISSVAALRGSGICPAYNASKAYVSNYLEGLHLKASRINKNITVTDLKPGFVDTAMAQGDGLFWVASASKAASQIYQLIKRRRPHGYVTKRWRLVAILLTLMPRWLYTRIME
jgi:short-subunit dehydrogenase